MCAIRTLRLGGGSPPRVVSEEGCGARSAETRDTGRSLLHLVGGMSEIELAAAGSAGWHEVAVAVAVSRSSVGTDHLLPQSSILESKYHDSRFSLYYGVCSSLITLEQVF